MNILIVEDDAYRISWFRKKLALADCLEITSDVSRAIDRLTVTNWDFLFLDHDLGINEETWEEKQPGRAVSTWLIANPDVLPKLVIIIHSMNAVSSVKIYNELYNAKRLGFRIPYTNLLIDRTLELILSKDISAERLLLL